MKSAAKPFCSLGRILPYAVAVKVGRTQVALRWTVSLLCGLTIPRNRFAGILRHSFAEEKSSAQGVLGCRSLLFSSLPKPFCRFVEVFSHPDAFGERFAKTVLSGCESLVGCIAEPLCSLRYVLSHAFTQLESIRECELRPGISCSSTLTEFLNVFRCHFRHQIIKNVGAEGSGNGSRESSPEVDRADDFAEPVSAACSRVNVGLANESNTRPRQNAQRG